MALSCGHKFYIILSECFAPTTEKIIIILVNDNRHCFSLVP